MNAAIIFGLLLVSDVDGDADPISSASPKALELPHDDQVPLNRWPPLFTQNMFEIMARSHSSSGGNFLTHGWVAKR